jgi:hypothetical protein
MGDEYAVALLRVFDSILRVVCGSLDSYDYWVCIQGSKYNIDVMNETEKAPHLHLIKTALAGVTDLGLRTLFVRCSRGGT